MFSRVALRSGGIVPQVLRCSIGQNGNVLTTRLCSTGLEKHLENWDKSNKLYYGPERDTAKFPITRQPELPPPTRMGILPASWFTFFHEKTGVTGPYVFGAGMVTFMLSKEIWVIEHGFTEFAAFWIAFAILAKKLGPGVNAWLEKQGQEYRAAHWDEPLVKAKQQAEEIVKEGELAVWQQEGQKMMFDAKRENVDLQLEATYRQRIADVHKQVKRQLDYHLEKETTKRNFEQNHMVDWIVSSVVKGITPQQEKDSINKCLADLKNLAAR